MCHWQGSSLASATAPKTLASKALPVAHRKEGLASATRRWAIADPQPACILPCGVQPHRELHGFRRWHERNLNATLRTNPSTPPGPNRRGGFVGSECCSGLRPVVRRIAGSRYTASIRLVVCLCSVRGWSGGCGDRLDELRLQHVPGFSVDAGRGFSNAGDDGRRDKRSARGLRRRSGHRGRSHVWFDLEPPGLPVDRRRRHAGLGRSWRRPFCSGEGRVRGRVRGGWICQGGRRCYLFVPMDCG